MSPLIVPKREPMPQPDSIRMGLRFAKSQARTLRNIAEHLRTLDPATNVVDISLFDKAADSAAEGEPLIVMCSDPDEVREMAAVFVRLGVKEPDVEDLNG